MLPRTAGVVRILSKKGAGSAADGCNEGLRRIVLFDCSTPYVPRVADGIPMGEK